MASTADNVLPQAISDFIASSGVNKNKCRQDKSYWKDHKQKCIKEGYYYNNSKKRSDDKNDQQCKRWKKQDKKKYDEKCKKVLADS